ncbi:Inhibitor of nuclear factor kappa B kinase beta subunit [Operophtera brumata]|uniref:IkappaB kinase n=1 Tax=Operophtera brumata TaxID=104452 RepID=A0A0L7L685_OPEBR|nr:Inhibitor of nuclear factor kappa B kinase beta subunit [Operophtera brumata]
MDDIVFIGDWIKDRVLGSGSFGVVVLWKHKRTDEKLAIKTCKWGDELTAKHKERWSKEVEMLQSCQNPNIVGTKELPPEFVNGLQRANPSGLPILCMEYCSGGDLRQVLNKPESCAGLKEQQVRQILSDIRNAMQFLHQNRITHRDLKPENVVMCVLDNVGQMNPQGQKMSYKLIDLGYAKEIDSNSICASFVGTLQYLAPEILYSKTYSNSVDFWSLGLLAFEVICGKRPFLPFMAPVQWMPHVKKKASSNICVYETFHEDIEYSDEIFPENHISKPFKAYIEEWLRIALEWDPKLRGRNAPSRVTFNLPAEEKEKASNIVIFEQLGDILSKKIIKIFSVLTFSELAYEIDNTTNVSTVKTWIQRDTNITAYEQILISQSNYVELENEDLLIKYWNERNDIMLSLFSKTAFMADSVEAIVPKSVQRCLEHPRALYNFKNSQNLYQNGVYFVQVQMEMFDSLVKGLFVRGESLKYEGNQLLLKHNSVDKGIGNLLAQDEILKKMIETGQKHITDLRDNSTGTNLLGGFDKIFKDAEDLKDKICKLKSAWSQVTVRLQSATRRCNEPISADLNNFVAKYNYTTVYTNAYKVFLFYKKSMNELRGKERQCHDMMKVCYDCLKLRSKILTEIKHQPFVLKLMDLSTEFAKIGDIVKNAFEHTEKLTADLANVLDELTNCTWSTISLIVKDVNSLSDLPYSVVSYEKKDFKIGESVSDHCIKMVNKVEEDDKLKSLIEDSLKIRQRHVHLTEKLNSQKDLLNKPLFDFSFLDEN